MRMLSSVRYRSVHPNDRDTLQTLHEEFFPVKYTDDYYQKISNGIGLYNGRAHSIVAVNERDEIVGFLFAQFLQYPSQVEDHYMFDSANIPNQAMYILILGVSPSYRKLGVASSMIQECLNYALTNRNCGAVYLHVIYYNKSALKLYEKNNFQFLQTIDDFYQIDNCYYSAHLYIYYLPGFRPPPFTRILYSIQSFFQASVLNISSMFESLWVCSPPPLLSHNHSTIHSSNNNNKTSNETV